MLFLDINNMSIQLQEKQTEEGKGNRIHLRVSFYQHSCDIVWLIFLCVRT